MSTAVTAANGATVFEVMNRSFSLQYKDYAGLGRLITAIDGAEQNATHFWFYWVDGNLSMLAADKHVLQDDASLLFRLTSEYVSG